MRGWSVVKEFSSMLIGMACNGEFVDESVDLVKMIFEICEIFRLFCLKFSYDDF